MTAIDRKALRPPSARAMAAWLRDLQAIELLPAQTSGSLNDLKIKKEPKLTPKCQGLGVLIGLYLS